MTAVHRVSEFDTWRPKYGAATVTVLVAGTTTPAALFTDEALTVAAPNPQTLETDTDVDGTVYGKFTVPLYTASAYHLDIDSIDQSGIERPPLTTLLGEDASKTVVTAAGGSEAVELEDIVARIVHAKDHGALSATDTAANTTTLAAAIGAAAADGGGFVFVPPGTFPVTALTLSVGVVLVGAGRGITTIQSQTAGVVITLGGDRAGLMGITLDGIDLQAGSVGVFAKAKDETHFVNAEIKRFEAGLHCMGGRRAEWRELYISACATGAKLHGDNDATGGADGDDFTNNRWLGGKVDLCTVIGVDLSYEDKQCHHNMISGVGFENNTGVGLNINGAQYTELPNSWWTGNTTNIAVDDDSDVVAGDPNKVIGLRLMGGVMDTGAANFAGQCQDVVFERMEIKGVSFNLTLPENAILLKDSTEDAAVIITGDGTKLIRIRAILEGASSGLTTSASATKAWSIVLEPGQAGILEAWVVGNQRDGIQVAQYHKVAKVHRPGSTLDYDAQTANYTVGEIFTGFDSGATARITADADGGAAGTLTLRDIVGDFENNEVATDPLGGSADVDGILVPQDVVIDQADTLGTDAEDNVNWNAAFVANGSEIELRVTGDTGEDVEWSVHVKAIVD